MLLEHLLEGGIIPSIIGESTGKQDIGPIISGHEMY